VVWQRSRLGSLVSSNGLNSSINHKTIAFKAAGTVKANGRGTEAKSSFLSDVTLEAKECSSIFRIPL
jgi:hypothetical protein